MKLTASALLVLSAFLFLDLAQGKLTSNDVEAILSTVPEQERNEYLRFQLNRGYELSEKKALSYAKVSPQISVELYNYYKEHKTIEETENLNSPFSLYDIICFPTGCIEIDDPSVHP